MVEAERMILPPGTFECAQHKYCFKITGAQGRRWHVSNIRGFFRNVSSSEEGRAIGHCPRYIIIRERKIFYIRGICCNPWNK